MAPVGYSRDVQGFFRHYLGGHILEKIEGSLQQRFQFRIARIGETADAAPTPPSGTDIPGSVVMITLALSGRDAEYIRDDVE